jgi:hypothetical protein
MNIVNAVSSGFAGLITGSITTADLIKVIWYPKIAAEELKDASKLSVEDKINKIAGAMKMKTNLSVAKDCGGFFSPGDSITGVGSEFLGLGAIIMDYTKPFEGKEVRVRTALNQIKHNDNLIKPLAFSVSVAAARILPFMLSSSNEIVEESNLIHLFTWALALTGSYVFVYRIFDQFLRRDAEQTAIKESGEKEIKLFKKELEDQLKKENETGYDSKIDIPTFIYRRVRHEFISDNLAQRIKYTDDRLASLR